MRKVTNRFRRVPRYELERETETERRPSTNHGFGWMLFAGIALVLLLLFLSNITGAIQDNSVAVRDQTDVIAQNNGWLETINQTLQVMAERFSALLEGIKDAIVQRS